MIRPLLFIHKFIYIVAYKNSIVLHREEFHLWTARSPDLTPLDFFARVSLSL